MDIDKDNILDFDEIGNWVVNAQERTQGYANDVVFEMGYGDPMLFSQISWEPQIFMSDDFEGNIRVSLTTPEPSALYLLFAGLVGLSLIRPSLKVQNR